MTSHRDRLLGQARADLVQLPDLTDELARLIADKPPTDGMRTGKPGSRAPLRLDVAHATDTRRKPGWHLEDPRENRLADWLGVAPLLESWVRVLADSLAEERHDWPELTEAATVRSECSTLIEHWDFITEHDWATELAGDITRIAAQVRGMLGHRPEYQPKCRNCRNTVLPVDADRKLTSWEACAYGACSGCDWTYPKGPALDALGQSQEPMTLADISAVIGIPVKTLHRWHKPDGLIAPVVDTKQRQRVFDLAAVRAVAQTKFGRKVG